MLTARRNDEGEQTITWACDVCLEEAQPGDLQFVFHVSSTARAAPCVTVHEQCRADRDLLLKLMSDEEVSAVRAGKLRAVDLAVYPDWSGDVSFSGRGFSVSCKFGDKHR